MNRDVLRAYAILGMKPGAPLAEVRRRYRFLARRWHPDRHSNDARNQAEAADSMRRISVAYECLASHLQSPARERTIGSTDGERSRLRRGEIEGMVQAIGAESPIDEALSAVGWVGTALEGILMFAFGLAWIARGFVILVRQGASALLGDVILWMLLAFAAVCALHELWVRRRAVRASMQGRES